MKSKGMFLFLGMLTLAFVFTGCLGETETNSTPTAKSTPVVEEEDTDATITLTASTYQPGDDVVISFNMVEEPTLSTWIGIVPSDTAHDDEEAADAADVDYEYIGAKQGIVTLTAPSEAGEYEVRIYSSDEPDALELGATSFMVTE